MSLELGDATQDDVEALTILRNMVAARLTADYGRGHWSLVVTDAGVRRAFKHARILVARDRGDIVATLRLVTKKPWAIDASYFTPVKKAIYLLDMAVAPDRQRTGIGRRLLDHALDVVRAWPADAIRLDAYDADAGAGDFYARCGFREVARVEYRTVPLVYYERLV